MQIILIKNDRLHKSSFSNEGVNQLWIKDTDEFFNERNLISIENKNNTWYLISNNDCYIEESNNKIAEKPLIIDNFYTLKITENNKTNIAILYITNEQNEVYKSFEIKSNKTYSIGSDNNQDIELIGEYINKNHTAIIKEENKVSLVTSNQNNLVYINEIANNNKVLSNGDIIFIFGFKIIFINDYLIINNFKNGLKINSNEITPKKLPTYNEQPQKTEEDDNAELYSENDYFQRTPRFVTSINEELVKIDSPPGKIEEDDTPVIYTVGPMLTMTMSSAVSVSTSVINLLNGKGTFASTIPALAISAAMIASTLLWPSLMRKYQKKKQRKQESERQTKYVEYLNNKKQIITNMRTNQFQILTENFKEPKDLENIILTKKRTLWERIIDHDDFLEVRLGKGTVPLKIKLSYTEEDFTMVEDNLKEELKVIAESAKDIENAPVTIKLTERNKLVLIGNKKHRESMLESLVLQLVTYHAYTDLKLVFMINESSNEIVENFKILPHTWSNSRDIRFFANNYDDMTKISFYLEQVFMNRKYTEESGNTQESTITYNNVSPYYLIVVDNIKKNQNIEIINKILKTDRNIGFGLIILNDGISNLPNECNDFLTAAGDKSAIIKNDLNKNNQQTFVMDDTSSINFSLLCEKLSNIPIKSQIMLQELKTSVGFLEMYKVGKVEQLNIFDRWEKNNPVNSLSVPIGIHLDGEIFNLDLHEKFHGPHGLIAGMTGSGKSEFIITFILSMCLNFNPEEVSFVLIDYKGGGLTGALENKVSGIKLPHLAGTITNLDKAEINRSLASIESELKRRQTLFNKAKVELNESTLDIYKYQKLYRDGQIKEPISHLFIISDEFAELKSQQHEFMDKLISAARIGRSLGVHLILATQKPSGIVDDQIWSNSKFKVCLKVQEKSDSMDVIKCADAASLKRAGQFYLQVGYNDYFSQGQSAYAGTKYIPKDKLTKIVERNISFLNDIGDTTKSIETVKRVETVSMGEELPNILNYIINAANLKQLKARKLWLDKIPKEIFVNNLINKYKFVPLKWDIKAIIGEYDDPNNQSQGILTLDFNNNGNTLIYSTGDGEIMISSIIYSLIITHTIEEVNIYIIDFGSEMFGIFKNAPQVGDIVYLTEQEKLINLFGTIAKELEIRKKLFVDYNGDYNLYIKESGNSLPRIIVIINNYESFSENYEEHIDTVSGLTREGERYGISFVISATGTNAVRTKTTQNFSKQLCLQFNDPSDYSSILGPTHGMIPSAITGRGLTKINGNIYEFQTAYPYMWNEINNYIKDICQKLASSSTQKAKKIAILPDHVRIEDVKNKITDIRNIPIGITKDTLEISSFDFSKNPISLISSQDISNLDKFIPSLFQVFDSIVETYIIDTSEEIKNRITKQNNYIKTLDITTSKILETTKENVPRIFIFYGAEQLKNMIATSKEVKDIIINLKNYTNIKIILADSISRIKQLEFEEFYRNNVQAINAIWIGSGITDQFTIKSSTYNKETRSQIPNDFGYNVNKGNAKLIKILDFYSND